MGELKKITWLSDALKLSVTQQAEMGLRPFDLGAFPVTAHPVASSGSIECENFRFAYTKQRDALDIDSLSLPQAGVIAVIGHNGAGKSTSGPLPLWSGETLQGHCESGREAV